MKRLKGIHHVTAITGGAQRNVDFYSDALGLRLVKKTVNFDDPKSYHLYYGDRFGTPGTLLTFFVWPGAGAGRTGTGEPVALAFEVPEGSLGWWRERLPTAGVTVEGSKRLWLADPDGMRVELAESGTPRESEYWPGGGVAREHAIKAIHSVTLALGNIPPSAALYSDPLGFVEEGMVDGRQRFRVGEASEAGFVDVTAPIPPSRGRMGAGTIHHLAFRTDDDASQRQWLERLTQLGLGVSPVMDRKYFHSLYFRELNGVLFEIATDGPGMAVDEPMEQLGEALALPNQYESLRVTLERTLPAIHSPRNSAAQVGQS